MRTTLLFAAGILSTFLLSGCYETRQEFVLNPDGSGKVTLEASFNLEKFSIVKDQTPEEQLKGAVRGLLEQSDGVDAWKDVSSAILDDGRGFFQGTAYFRDVADLKFHNLGNTKVKLVEDSINEIKFVIEFGQTTEKEAPEENPAVELSDEEIAKELVKAKSKYAKELRPMMVVLLAGMKEHMLFHMPGTVQEGSNLKTDVNGNLSFVFEGSKVIEGMDRLFENDELLRREIKAGADVVKDGPSSGDDFQMLVFGIRPPFTAKLSGPFHPLFNYANEVAAARADYAAMTKALGIVARIPITSNPEGSGFKELKVGGVRLVKFSDLEGGIRPFNHNAGYTLSVIGELLGQVTSIEGGEVLKAIADNGADLLPTKEWDRRISFPELSKDKTMAIFDINMLPPDDAIKGIKEISGTMTYSVANGWNEIDLEISELKQGTTGKEFNSIISSIGDWGKGQALSIQFDLPKEALKEVRIFDEAGSQVKISGTSISWGGNQSTFTLICDPKFPDRGRIVVSVYEQPKKYKVPFTIEHISLTGQPL